MFEDGEFPPQRTKHPGIPLVTERLKSMMVHKLQNYDMSVDRIKAKDRQFAKVKAEREGSVNGYQHGLITAHVGSIYDVAD